MKQKLFFLALIFLLCHSSLFAIVDTLAVRSNSMNKEVAVITVLPNDYNEQKNKSYPVVYLLHGHGNNHKCWPGIKPNLSEIATEKQVIFVCPDGKTSWYWDSPVDPSLRYETFTSNELVSFIDSKYRTIKDRKARAITGLSMGGQGALYVAINNRDVFGAAGSTSGGVDIRPFPNNWNMSQSLGARDDNKERWDEFAVINQFDKIQNGDLALIIDCGTEDFFFGVNNALHAKLLEKKINHDYIVRPGAHNQEYWRNSIDYQILFFAKYFAQMGY